MRKAPMADVNRVGNDGVVAGLSRRRVDKSASGGTRHLRSITFDERMTAPGAKRPLTNDCSVLPRMFKDGDEWKDTDQLGTGDLLNAAKLLERAEQFISEQ
jgi:hypothetical protein